MKPLRIKDVNRSGWMGRDAYRSANVKLPRMWHSLWSTLSIIIIYYYYYYYMLY